MPTTSVQARDGSIPSESSTAVHESSSGMLPPTATLGKPEESELDSLSRRTPEQLAAIQKISDSADEKRLKSARKDYLLDKHKASDQKRLKSAKKEFLLDKHSAAEDRRLEAAKREFLIDKKVKQEDLDRDKEKKAGFDNISSLKDSKEAEFSKSAGPGKFDLGDDLSAMHDANELGGYEFDRKNDTRSAPLRYLSSKFTGAAHYVKKHPFKSMAKLVPLAGPAMSLATAVKSHGRKGDARSEQSESSTEAMDMMWGAHKRQQSKQRNKKAISAAVGIATTAAGGMVDFGAGDLAADVGSDAAGEAAGFVGNMIDGSVSHMTEGVGRGLAEMTTEDVISGSGEDVTQTVRDKLGKSKSLIPTARKSRVELKKGSAGDKALAHRSLLSKDTEYGNVARKAVKTRNNLARTLDDSILDKSIQSSDGVSAGMSLRDSIAQSQRGEDLPLATGAMSPQPLKKPELHDSITSEALIAKKRMLSQFSQTKQKMTTTAGDGTMNVGEFKHNQALTEEARTLRLAKQFGYEKGISKKTIDSEQDSKIEGSTSVGVKQKSVPVFPGLSTESDKEAIEKRDNKLDHFKEKSFFEA